MHERQLDPFATPQLQSATKTRDNKVRLSHDVLDKAQMIAAQWGLKNARAAIEAVFRCYADEYLGKVPGNKGAIAFSPSGASLPPPSVNPATNSCEALDVLDELLGT